MWSSVFHSLTFIPASVNAANGKTFVGFFVSVFTIADFCFLSDATLVVRLSCAFLRSFRYSRPNITIAVNKNMKFALNKTPVIATIIVSLTVSLLPKKKISPPFNI